MSVIDDDPSILFKGALPTTHTAYVPVPIRNGTLGCQISWPDATSAATITLELSSHKAGSPTSAEVWKDSGETFTGPAATAAGSLLINIENVRQRRAQLKIVTSAATILDIRDGTAP